MMPPPTYNDHESESDSVASRSPKSRISASAHGGSSASTIYDYLDALETESALQFDMTRQTGSRSSHRQGTMSTGAPPSYERGHRGDAWNESADGRGGGLASPAGSNISDQSGASNAYYVEIKAKLATMTIELNVGPRAVGSFLPRQLCIVSDARVTWTQDKSKTIERLKAARKKDKAKTRQLLAAAEEGHKEQLKFEKELEQHLDFAQGLVTDKVSQLVASSSLASGI